MLASTFVCLWAEVARLSCFNADQDGPRMIEGKLPQMIDVLRRSARAHTLHPSLLVREAGLCESTAPPLQALAAWVKSAAAGNGK